jgi:tetratricopeptide (TPR) repeat protein
MAQALDWLGEVAGWRGEWEHARALWAESLAHYERFGALEECVDVLCRRADCLQRQGVPAEADFRQAEELSRRAGQPLPPMVSLGLARSADDLTRALAATRDDFGDAPTRSRILTALGRHEEAIAVARTSPFVSNLAAAVEGLASTANAERAAFLLGAAVALRGMAIAGDPLTTATAARATATLGPEGFAAAYAQGARLSRTEALAQL